MSTHDHIFNHNYGDFLTLYLITNSDMILSASLYPSTVCVLLHFHLSGHFYLLN